MSTNLNYIILLPPSESKKIGGDETKPYRFVQNIKSSNYFSSLSLQREEIYGKLREAIAEQGLDNLSKILELKGDKLKYNIDIISDFLNKRTMPAIQRYNGVMFKYINYDKMSEKLKNNFDNSVIFVDGMFGLLKPQDLIPEYKLKITSKFLDIDITKFWKENLKGILSSIFKDKIIIDILPQTHRKAITFDESNKHFIIKFCEIKDNKLVNVGHDSKELKGELINYLVQFENLNEEKLKNFGHSKGFKFSEKYSSKKEIIFLKD